MLPLKRATRPPSKNRAHLDTVQLVLNNRTMKIKTATTIFEVLASEVRLSIFRLLVKYAPEGLVAGEISQMLDIPKTNLSFHLKNIMYSGLVSMEREGRNTRYRANIPLMLETIAYLASECCSGNSAHCQPYLAEGGIEPEFLSVYCQKQTYDTEITTMDTADKTKSSEDVKETVRAGYAAIATGQRSCCCSSQRGSQVSFLVFISCFLFFILYFLFLLFCPVILFLQAQKKSCKTAPFHRSQFTVPYLRMPSPCLWTAGRKMPQESYPPGFFPRR